MKILVPVKRVIDPYIQVRLDANGLDVVRDGVPHAINPFDEVALTKAVALRRTEEANEVVAVSIGPAAARESLRTALAIGADRALHLRHEGKLTSCEVARALADLFRMEKADLVLIGKQAVDDDAAQTAPLFSVFAGLSYLPDIFSLQLAHGQAIARYELNGDTYTARAPLPAIASCELHLAEPRPIGLKQKMAAKKKSIDSRPLDLPARRERAPERLGLRIADSRPPCQMVESTDELVARLRQKGVWPS